MCPHCTGAPENLLSAGDVATLFRVDPKTVTRWANEGWLACTRTLGGHRRYSRDEVDAIIATGRRPGRRDAA
jgi:excisionase family DNA binding protein